MKLEKFDRAEELLIQLSEMNDIYRKEQSKWFLALCSIREDNTEQAEQYLKEVVEIGGKYQKQAGRFYQQAGLHGMDVNELVPIVHRVLQSRNPKPYLLVGKDALIFELMAKLLPVRWRDWQVLRQMGLHNL